MKFPVAMVVILAVAGDANAQLAADKCKYLGNIIANSTPSDFTQYWNQVTPENAGKWGTVEAVRDQMNWDALDNAYNTAKSNGLPFKQHTLVWGQQQPPWMSELAPEEQKAEVEEWISAFCSRYPATDMIDVVNEPLHAAPSYNTALGGQGTTGWDWVVWTFEKARAYCPNAKLLLNDYNIVNNNAATDAYLRIINVLKSKELIDGVGEQGHFLEQTPLATISANLEKLGQAGLPIHISEFDLNFSSDVAQQERYQELFPLLWEHAGVHGITLWGYKQGQIWRTDGYLIRSDGTDRPAFTWLKSYVAESNGGSLCVGVGLGAEDEDQQIHVSPNPVTGSMIKVHIPSGDPDMRIIDNLGNQVGAGVLRHGVNEVEIAGVPGLYILVLSDGNKTVRLKIIRY